MFKNLVTNLSKNQKIIIVILAQFIFAILLASIVSIVLSPKEYVEIKNEDEAGAVPVKNWNGIKKQLWYLLQDNVASLDKSDIDDAVIRDGTYSEETENDITTARFLLDIDSLKQTYYITVSWSDKVELYDYLSIDCPRQDQMKYPETACYGMYNNTYSLDLYLPYMVESQHEDGAPDVYIEGDEANKTIDVMVSVCDLEKYKKMADDYLKSTPIRLSEYTISYEVNTTDVICSDEDL